MALLKSKKPGSTEKSAPAAEGEAAPKSGNKLLGLLAPLLVFGAAFGASWFAGVGVTAPVTRDAVTTPPAAAAYSADWTPQRSASTVAIDPLTITAGSRGQILKIGLAIEVWDKQAEIDVPKLRDAFTTYLRALDPAQLSDPSFHMRLKRALLHRARVVIGQDVIADVLITDFLLTS